MPTLTSLLITGISGVVTLIDATAPGATIVGAVKLGGLTASTVIGSTFNTPGILNTGGFIVTISPILGLFMPTLTSLLITDISGTKGIVWTDSTIFCLNVVLSATVPTPAITLSKATSLLSPDDTIVSIVGLHTFFVLSFPEPLFILSYVKNTWVFCPSGFP